MSHERDVSNEQIVDYRVRLMDLSEDEVWALGLSFFESAPIYQKRHGPTIIANASELPRESEERRCRWITSRQVSAKIPFELYSSSANAEWPNDGIKCR